MQVLLSGVHSGPNPSPGVGTARSLRQAFPDLRLVGVDYSNRSSGLHDPIFDDVWVVRPWGELDLDLHARHIRGHVGGDGVWLSGLDLETIWLSQTPAIPGVLSPSARSLRLTAKPGIRAHRQLGLKVPPFVPTTESDWELHRFCRRFGWRVWLKGPYHEAIRVQNWAQLQQQRSTVADRWSTDDLFLQADVTGVEESVAFAGCGGRLVDAVAMAKRDLTVEGKTWAGRITEVEPTFRRRLEHTVDDLGWNGGGEVECVRDAEGDRWVIDWNPRFPAWIHGATLAGHNLPAQLFAAAAGLTAPSQPAVATEFTRVIYEVPVRRDLPLPAIPDPPGPWERHVGKHPSAAIELAKRLHSGRRRAHREPPVPESVLADVAALQLDALETPARVLLPETARERFERGRDAARTIARQTGVDVSVGYSIKTDPDPTLMSLALDSGLLAEAISQHEVQSALDVGFRPDQVVLNGPAGRWPACGVGAPPSSLRVVFNDSLEALEAAVAEPTQAPIGIRIRPPGVVSRFGISIADPPRYARLVRLLRSASPERGLAVHFHIASNVIGVLDWWTTFDSVLDLSAQLSEDARRPLVTFDMGGGWFPDDWFDSLLPTLGDRLSERLGELPDLAEIILEPGKALSQPVRALTVRVLEVRERTGGRDGGRDIVVDGAISDLPEAHGYPHRILTRDGGGEWRPAPRGRDRLLGRICMEHDFLALGVRLPAEIAAGDHLVVADAGAYDRSMSYAFGYGH